MSDVPDISTILADFAPEQANLLPILHEVQAKLGCVDSRSEAAIAAALNLTRAEVHGVVSFYHDFAAEADPRPCVELCRAEACQARGVERLVHRAEAEAGQRVRIRTIFCLGLCSVGPAARVGDALHARLDEDKLVALVKSA